jgi:S1-C subfamily serine protease
VVPELIETGHASFPGVGVAVAPRSISVIDRTPGLIITKVQPGTPAQKAGLRARDQKYAGDVLTQVNGRRVVTLADLNDRLTEAGIGGDVRAKILRGRQVFTATLAVIDETNNRRIKP